MTDAGAIFTGDLRQVVDSGQRFAVILADPPWRFETWSEAGKDRSAEQHYSCMSLDEIKALPVRELAAKDCALFLWGTWPTMPQALEVISAWGFEYKTVGFVWVKTLRSAEAAGAFRLGRDGAGLHVGNGYWTRANTEFCLIGARGRRRRRYADVHQVVMAPVAEHSVKPVVVHARIERLLSGPYLELFARRPMPGWTVWGNQIARGLFDSELEELIAERARYAAKDLKPAERDLFAEAAE